MGLGAIIAHKCSTCRRTHSDYILYLVNGNEEEAVLSSSSSRTLCSLCAHVAGQGCYSQALMANGILCITTTSKLLRLRRRPSPFSVDAVLPPPVPFLAGHRCSPVAPPHHCCCRGHSSTLQRGDVKEPGGTSIFGSILGRSQPKWPPGSGLINNGVKPT